MGTIFFVSHPEVIVDPLQPVTAWSLSQTGERRMRAFERLPVVASVGCVFCSGERKAQEAARLLALPKGVPIHVRDELGENDRTSTGYLAQAAFEQAADAFFARPELSYRGWETAVAAQQRIVAAFSRALDEAKAGDFAIVSHGAVGTLLKCFLKEAPISRNEDQPRQGHYYTIDRSSRHLTSDWITLPDIPADSST